MKRVSSVDLKRQFEGDTVQDLPGIGESLKSALSRFIQNELDISVEGVIEHAPFIGGKYIEKFEKEFARYCNTAYCVGVNSGTDALEFALRCNGITSGEVITVPNSYFTTASSINQAGCTPVFVDVDERTFTLNSRQLEECINNETQAIIPVHLYGRPAEMERVIEIAKKYRLAIIEDCCQAHGARVNGARVPISGTGAFSFYPRKNLGGWGDGGALVTNSPEVARLAKLWRNDGAESKYSHVLLGRKARLDSLQAVILLTKLPYLDLWNSLRRVHAQQYTKLLSNLSDIQIPLLGDNKIVPVFHIYNILTNKRDSLKNHLHERGIETNIHYPTPIHLQPAYKDLRIKEGSFPVAEKLAKTTLSLPMFPELRDDEIVYVCDAVKEFFV